MKFLGVFGVLGMAFVFFGLIWSMPVMRHAAVWTNLSIKVGMTTVVSCLAIYMISEITKSRWK